MSRVRLVVSLMATACLCVFAGPATAKPQSFQWQLVADPAPGTTGLDGIPYPGPPRIFFGVANNTPYLAEITRSPDFDLTVYRAVGGRAWQQIGDGPLNDPDLDAGSADFATEGGSVWIAWDENDGTFDGQRLLHVARITSSGVRELPGSPIAGASGAQIAYFGGRLYVVYTGTDGLAAVRTRSNGRGFEPVGGLDGASEFALDVGVYRGRLYAAGEPNTGVPLRYWTLNRRQSAWSEVDPAEDPLAQRIGNTVYSLRSAGSEGPGAPAFVRVFATQHGVTTELPSPAQPGNNVIGPKLIAENGTVWMEWIEGGAGDMQPPFVPHVARLVRR